MVRLSLLLSSSAFSLLLSSCQGFVSPATSRLVTSVHTAESAGNTHNNKLHYKNRVVLHQSASDSSSSSTKKSLKRPLVLLTFDLDDTLYPIASVIEEANTAFAKAMERYGYTGIQPNDIDEMTKKVRAEMDPQEAAALSHTEARELAIRRVMEQALLERKLQETAIDWVTSVADLSPVVVENARRWTARAVSPSIVQAVLTAWEMERHHAAERNLYPEVLAVLTDIQKKHPNVIIGAVTDGKANPMLMTFTLAPYFDFCMSWEDDQKGRTQFFKDLASSNTAAQLTWIYNAAVEKGQELATVNAAIKAAKNKKDNKNNNGEGADTDQAKDEGVSFENGVWIHVGDDLAYDVGGAAACGAKTILCELADEYGQTARQRFDALDDLFKGETVNGAATRHAKKEKMPAWSTSTSQEMQVRREMNEAARPKVSETINFIRELPDAINRIVAAAQDEEGSLLQATVLSSTER